MPGGWGGGWVRTYATIRATGGGDSKNGAKLGDPKKGGRLEMGIAAFLPKILQFLIVCQKPLQNICYSFVPFIHRLSI